MLPKNKKFKLFSCCLPVKGYSRSIICDIQRQTFDFIPTILFDILREYEGKTIIELIDVFGTKNSVYIEEYFDFLYRNEYIFFCDNEEEMNTFPKLSLEWDVPFDITNIIIDISTTIQFDIRKVVTQLDTLNCPHIQFRIFKPISWSIIEKIVVEFEESSIKTIHFILPFDKKIPFEKIKEICFQFKRITLFQFFGAVEEKRESVGYTKIFYIKEYISPSCCGNIDASYFMSNIDFFTESQHHNTCLNRKISIDTEGNIKNCPSMSESYGNIKDTTLKEALNHPDFKKYWNITKDKIHVCKDCEFRHICTDCRAYIEKPEDIYSKPLKCGYNPYTNEWSEWSDNPLKQKAMTYYRMES